jgi:hypothetical protein
VASGENEYLPPDPTSRPDESELPLPEDTAAESPEPNETFAPIDSDDALPDLTLDLDAASNDASEEPAAEAPAEQPIEASPAMEETAAFEPVTPEVTETLQVPEPTEGSGETAAFEALASETGETSPAAEPEGLGETAVFEGPTPEAAEGLGSSVDASTAVEGEPTEGVTTEVTETQPAAEGGSLTDGLLASGILAAAGTAEGEAAAGEESAEEKPEEEGEKQPGVFARFGAWVADTSVYNVLLFFAMVALLLGSLALVQELQNYNWDIKARDAKRPVAAAGPHYGPPSTTALA